MAVQQQVFSTPYRENKSSGICEQTQEIINTTVNEVPSENVSHTISPLSM